MTQKHEKWSGGAPPPAPPQVPGPHLRRRIYDPAAFKAKTQPEDHKTTRINVSYTLARSGHAPLRASCSLLPAPSSKLPVAPHSRLLGNGPAGATPPRTTSRRTAPLPLALCSSLLAGIRTCCCSLLAAHCCAVSQMQNLPSKRPNHGPPTRARTHARTHTFPSCWPQLA